MQRLIAAAHGVRVAEARLYGFAYAPMPRVVRGSAGNESPAQYSLKSVAGEILAKVPATDAEAHHVRAISHLVDGNAEAAAKGLEELANATPKDARVWSDLAAARYQLARKDDDAQGYASALAAAASAVEADPSLPEARFNYALAAGALHLEGAAVSALKQYLTLDGMSEWAIEARRRLSFFERPKPDWKRTAARIERAGATPAEIQQAVTEFPQQTRTYAEGEYLARWAEAFLVHRDGDADHWLSLARSIGDVLKATSGESLLHDAVTAIGSASPDGRAKLATAHLTYRRGRMTYAKQNPGDAVPLLADSERLFSNGGSPMALMARYFRANALTDREENSTAIPLLASIDPLPPGYIALQAHVLKQQGYVFARTGRLYESLDQSVASVDRFERLGEKESVSRVTTSIAAIYETLGKPRDSFVSHGKSLATATESGDIRALDAALNSAARDELRERRPDVARALLDVDLTLPVTSPRLRADSLLQRLNAAPAGAIGDLDRVRAAAAAIPDARVREEALDDVRLVEASRLPDAASAIRLLDQCVDFRVRGGLQLMLPAAYLERALAYRRLRRVDDALSNLQLAATAIEQQRAAIEADELRDTFFTTASRVFSELFAMQFANGDYGAAFETMERFRGRVLVDRLLGVAGTHASPLTSGEIISRLPPHTLIAEYVVHDGQLVILTLGPRGLTAHAAATQDLETAIDRFSGDFASVTDDRLFDLLIAPIRGELASATTLVVLPDDSVAAIPFAALRNAKSGRYLVEDVAVIVAPSASAYVLARDGAPVQARRPLLIGDPSFDRVRFPDLPRLEEANAEVKQISMMYPGAEVLTGASATRSRVMESMRDKSLIHIGAHAIVDDGDPSRSLLALAQDGTDSGILYLRDILNLHLGRGATLVLAGCRTGLRGKGYGSMRSLALAFLAAGCRNVVGTLRDVDDDVGRRFSLEFYRALRTGMPASIALRTAQLSMLQSPDARARALQTWGAFQLYGSD